MRSCGMPLDDTQIPDTMDTDRVGNLPELMHIAMQPYWLTRWQKHYHMSHHLSINTCHASEGPGLAWPAWVCLNFRNARESILAGNRYRYVVLYRTEQYCPSSRIYNVLSLIQERYLIEEHPAFFRFEHATVLNTTPQCHIRQGANHVWNILNYDHLQEITLNSNLLPDKIQWKSKI